MNLIELSGMRVFKAKGRSLQILEEMLEEQRAEKQRCYEYAKRISASAPVCNVMGALIGFYFDTPPGDGWIKRDKYWVPDVHTSAGVKIRNRLKGFRMPNGWDLGARLGLLDCRVRVRQREYFIVSNKETIEDAEPIKMSEYIALLEEKENINNS